MPQNKLFRDFRKLNRLIEDGSVFTAFDTETTGLHPVYNRIIEIGAVKFDKNGVIGTFSQLVNPQTVISPQITKICHIDNLMVDSCPTIQDILPKFLEFIHNTILIAHNANFDVNFVNTELERCGMGNLPNHIVDTLELSKWAYPRLGKYSQPFLAAALQIDVKNAHRADDDALVCKNIFLRCIRDTKSIQK